MTATVVTFPGTSADEVHGAPRPDMAKVLRELADRADQGDFISFAFVAITDEIGVTTAIASPWNAPVTLMGALEDAKLDIREQKYDVGSKDVEPA